MPKIRLWLEELLDGLRRRFGDPEADGDLRFSPHLVLAFTVPEMLGRSSGPGRRTRTSDAPSTPSSGRTRCGKRRAARCTPRGSSSTRSPPGWTGAPPRPPPGKPLVCVRRGTATARTGRRFLDECFTVFAERPGLRAVMVDPAGSARGAADAGVGTVLVRPRVAQLAVLRHASAVVCHGGHNTVCEALSLGLPLVVAPIRDDQMIVAEQVTRSGAGVRLRFDRARAPQIGAAVEEVLTEPSYRDAAERLRASFAAAGGVGEAADRLLRLATRHE